MDLNFALTSQKGPAHESVKMRCRDDWQERAKWRQISSTVWRGEFRNARAVRSPTSAGVEWRNVKRITTRSNPSGSLISDMFPIRDSLSEREVCQNIGGCSDITVIVQVEENAKLSLNFCRPRQRVSVSKTDLNKCCDAESANNSWVKVVGDARGQVVTNPPQNERPATGGSQVCEK